MWGIIILVGAFALIGVGFVMIMIGGSFLSKEFSTLVGDSPQDKLAVGPENGLLLFVVGIALILGVFVLFIWQILDARKLCRKYNECVSMNGNRPLVKQNGLCFLFYQ